MAETPQQYLARIGKKGGEASSKSLSDKQRKTRARKAAEARWAKTRALVDEITEGTKALLRKTNARKAAQARWAKQKKRNA
jgi:hypothetical protein